MMSPVQQFLVVFSIIVLGLSGICIKRYIIGNIFHLTFTNVFYYCYVINVFNFFQRFFTSMDDDLVMF